MALITRLSRLFHADMNAVLDQIEEPELLLRQAIREMEESQAQHQTQIKLAEYDQQRLVEKEHEVKQFLTELDEQLAVCFKSDKNDLAHGLVKQKLEIKQTLKAITGKLSTSAENIKQLTLKLKEQQAQLGSMQQKADIFNQGEVSNMTHSRWDVETFSISDEAVEVAFLQEKQNWSRS